MNQRHLLPPVDQQLLARLAAHPDPAEAARRRRLIEDEPGRFEANQARNDALSKLLGPSQGALETMRFDRIIRACCWGALSDNEAHQPVQGAPLAAVAPAGPRTAAEARAHAPTCPSTPPTVLPAAPPQPSEAENVVPAGRAPLTPTLRAPCTGAAIEFLRAALSAGERESREVQAEGATYGLTPAMIRAARQYLGVATEKRGFGSACRGYWRLPRRPLVTTDVQSGVTPTQPAGVTPSAAQGEVTR